MRAERLSQAKLAVRLNVSTSYVRERLALLKLPAAVQAHIASGALPLGLAKLLRDVAKVSPAIAEGLADMVAEGAISASTLAEEPGSAVDWLDDFFNSEDRSEAPFAAHSSGWLALARLPLPEELRARFSALNIHGISLSTEDVDAARAYGCLLALDRSRYGSTGYVCDAAFLIDRLTLRIEERERAEPAREQEDRARAERAEADDAAPPEPEAAATQRAAERAAQAEDRLAARGANLELGRKLAERFHAPALTTESARLLALLVLAEHGESVTAAGLRYVREDWQTVEVIEQKNGLRREKVTYLERRQARTRFAKWLDRAKRPEEIIGRVLQAVIAAGLADEQAVAGSHRIGYALPGSSGYGGERPENAIPALVEHLAEPILPPRLAEQAEERRAARARFTTSVGVARAPGPADCAGADPAPEADAVPPEDGDVVDARAVVGTA